MKMTEQEFDELEKVFDYYHSGYQCAQVMLLYALELLGKENPDLVRSLGGLNKGISDYQQVCGCLSGGACLISYFAGKGSEQESAQPELEPMLKELVDWFKEFNNDHNGSVICHELLDDDLSVRAKVCPLLIINTLHKCIEMLERNELV
ncbi:MAG: C_GCAxxG_C_C family protein [Erysipelotrichaceae bacterium]|nr:C_GCAxxG_C_C family protein [Erysipelotrichaceae bacterium]